ncbi:MAG: hypothetical protein EBY80_16995, partial [Actinobacteria bacterium]|nr:hypothetical protein [Actinomycetota bacterium]
MAVNSYNAVMDIAAVDGKVFTHSARSDGIHVMCLDTLAVGGPAPCPGQPYSIADGQFFNDSDDHMMAIAGKIYSLRSNGASRSMWCIDPALIATGASSASVGCAGWATNPVSVTGWGPIIAAPNSSGSLVAACTLGTSTCLNLQDGTSVVSGLPSNLKTNLNSFGVGSLNQHATYSGVATAGTRVYWPGNDVIYCFNAATNAMCSGGSWSSGAVSETKVYAVRSDPANPNCFWSNADTGSIKIRDGVTGALGCSSQSPIVRFPASVSVPRMACTANSGIQEWVDFRLPLS